MAMWTAWLPCREPPVAKTGWSYLLQCNRLGDGMAEDSKRKPAPECIDRHFGGWRVVVSAWALVVLVVLCFAGAEALASHHAGAPGHAKLAGAVIPRHDPASAGVGAPCASLLAECGKSAAALGPEMPYGYPLW